MNKKILNEINQMKYLFGYERGRVISEQKGILKETLDPVDSDYDAVFAYYSGNTDTDWSFDGSSWGNRDEDNDDKGFIEVNLKNTGDTNCRLIIYDTGIVKKKDCDTFSGKETDIIWGTWTWDGTKPTLKFKGEFITTDAEGYYDSTDTGFTETKIMGLGAEGDTVKRLQAWLVENGYGTAEEVGGSPSCSASTEYTSCDGIYGEKTKEAVKKFQEDADITNDGIFGKETYYATSGLDLG